MTYKRDKIFENTFEDTEFELNSSISFELAPICVDNRSEEEKIEYQQIREHIHTLVIGSPFNRFNKVNEFNEIQRLKKQDINEVYGFITDEIGKEFSIIEIYSELCNYFNINPTRFYNALANVHKERLIHSLDQRTNVLSKKNINKLF